MDETALAVDKTDDLRKALSETFIAASSMYRELKKRGMFNTQDGEKLIDLCLKRANDVLMVTAK